MSFRALLFTYIIGGLTFVPILLLAFLAFAYFSLPRVSIQRNTPVVGNRAVTKDGTNTDDTGFVDKDEVQGTSGTDAAGYFAVCREYVPGGVNGKPPERSSPAGEVLNAESPSVYQSMYRSIFERNKTSAYSLDTDKKDPKAVKRPRNVFFVVLRHEHLLLFDNADQLEVRHVISLLHHTVDIHGGEGPLLEDDMFIKRNAIRLTRKQAAGSGVPTSEPFYIFSDNCSEKEDFYHALLAAQHKTGDVDAPPQPRKFDMDHIIKLVQALHTSDADPHSRWFNALIGRLFLAIYGTEEAESGLKAKIDRKVAQAPKPNFISSIQVQNVQLGHAAPTFSNFKLRELMVDGSLTIETDVKYHGNLRIQIAAIARIDLGPCIRAREVDLVLAGLLRKLSGHLLIKIKPPPSNRMWISFETMPHIDLSVEPVVSSMQITYGVILRAIESKIREVIGETLVYPNWDDIPFFDTRAHGVRGGIWDVPKGTGKEMPVHGNDVTDSTLADSAETAETGTSRDHASNLPPPSAKSSSMPSLLLSPEKEVKSRKARKPVTPPEPDSASAAISAPGTPSAAQSRSRPTSPRATPADKPKSMRVNSFAALPTTSVSTDDVVQHANTRKVRGHREAVDVVKEVKSRSDSISAQQRPNADPQNRNILDDDDALDAESPLDSVLEGVSTISSGKDDATSETLARRHAHSSTMPLSIGDGLGRKRTSWAFAGSPQQAGSALERAATTAKTWGISMINRQKEAAARKSISSGFTSLAKEAGLDDTPADSSSTAAVLSKSAPNGSSESVGPSTGVIGRAKPAARVPLSQGQAAPSTAAMTAALKAAGAAPGVLPPQQKQSLWANSSLNSAPLKRKPVMTHGIDAASASSTPPPTAEPDGGVARAQPEFITQHHRRTSSLSSNLDNSDPAPASARSDIISQGRSRKSSVAAASKITRTASDPDPDDTAYVPQSNASVVTTSVRDEGEEAKPLAGQYSHGLQATRQQASGQRRDVIPTPPAIADQEASDLAASQDGETIMDPILGRQYGVSSRLVPDATDALDDSHVATTSITEAAIIDQETTPPSPTRQHRSSVAPVQPTNPGNHNGRPGGNHPAAPIVQGKLPSSTADSVKEKPSLLSLGALSWGGGGAGNKKATSAAEDNGKRGGNKKGAAVGSNTAPGVARRISGAAEEKTKRD